MAKSNFIVRGGADFSALKKELDNTQKQLQGFKANVNGMMKQVGRILGTLAIGKLIKDSTQVAMTVESSMNQINRMMGSSAEAFQNWVDTQAKGFGMAKSEVYKFGAVYANLISGFSSGTEETAQRTQDLLQTTAVIASATGRSFEDTSERIRSGLLGSTEAIEDLGINVNVAMLESTEAFRRFAGDSSWQQLDFQTQQNIRLAAIMEQAYRKYGDTLADTTATRHMMFIASLKNIQLSLGQAFLPIWNAVLPVLTSMANAIGRVINLIAQFTSALFGSAKSGKTQTSTINNQVSSMQDLSNATTGAGKAAANAGKAAKKAAKDAKGVVASFDQINILSQNQNSNPGDGSGGGSDGGGGGTIDIPDIDTSGPSIISEAFNDMTEKVNAFKAAIEPTTKALKKLWNEGLSKLGGFVWGSLQDFYNNFLVPIGKFVLGEKGIPKLINAFNDLLNKINWDKLRKSLNNFWEAVSPLAVAVGEGFIDFMGEAIDVVTPVVVKLLERLADALNMISDALKEMKPETFENFGKFLGGLTVAKIGSKAIESLGKALEGLPLKLGKLGSLDPNFLVAAFGDVFIEIEESISTWIEQTFGTFWSDVADVLFVGGIGAGVGFSFAGPVGALVGGLGTALVGAVTTESFKDFREKVKEKIEESFYENWGKVGDFALDVRARLISTLENWQESISEWEKKANDYALEIKAKLITKWKDLKKDWNKLTKNIKNKGIEFTAEIGTKWSKLKGKWNDLTKNVKDKSVEFKAEIGTKWSSLKSKWNDLTKNIKDETATFKAQIGTKWAELKDSWAGLTDNIKDKTASFKGKIATMWSELSASWGNLTTNIKDKTADFRGKVATKWNELSESWNNITKNIKDKTASMKAKVGTVWSDLKTSWNKLMEKFKDKTVKIKVTISTIIDSIKSWINTKFIGPVNEKLRWTGVSIPKLAKGGIIDSPTLAMVGEAGKEAVMPLENNTGWITDLAGQIATQMGVGTGDGSPIELTINLGSIRIFKEIINGINMTQRQAGKTLINV